MGYEKTIVRSLSRVEARKLGLALLVGCCLVVVTYFISMSDTAADQQPPVYYKVRDNGEGKITLPKQEEDKVANDESQNKKPAAVAHTSIKEEITESRKPEETIHPRIREEAARIEKMKPPAAPVCDLSNFRTEFCDMTGDARVRGGKPSSVMFASARHQNAEWQIVPYVRKHMENIEKVAVKVTNDPESLPRCTAKNSVPAIVFALGGFTGNYYHDYTDVLLPLFLTARQFHGEVQFLITNIQVWWLLKYQPIIKALTRYEPVDLDRSGDQVFCHPHVMVGLRFHNDLVIEPPRAPNGYSMLDFTAFLRATYGLQRDRAVSLREQPARRPRLLLVARNGTRRFANVPEIVRVGEELGFEVVRADAKFGNVSGFAGVVNSCDVIMGVHGAGLTNFVFMPRNAVLIQIVPCCELQGMAAHTFRQPSTDAGLHYLEYNIAVEESTLLEIYPRDHPVFTDPQSLHRKGFYEMGKVYLGQQNVRLDLNRFRPFLLKAMDLLRQ
ncbi:hypothetical protein Cni_G12556 [Canna indica]|uniref:Glycosyltransferase 61 catalytic domain-containing protein n=1 Tax=Canna indica TaxID=4628 RepID=A0AAQ3KDQ6_9LILI|nr:hypothetical protein Cni_G12556 [Canna indica]